MSNRDFRYYETISSFRQIKLIIQGYCRINYLNEHYDIQNYTFPQNILESIYDYIYIYFNIFSQEKNYIPQLNWKENKGPLSALPKRIRKEIDRLNSKGTPPGITVTIHPQNYRYFLWTISGPNDTPYENGIFYLEMFLTKEYPMRPPKVRFLTKILHQDIDILGRICLNVLKDRWTPALNMSRIMLAIQLLLKDPNPIDPFDSTYPWRNEFAEKIKLEKRAKEWTKKYAMDY